MSFLALPSVPQSGLTPLEFQLFNALRQNIEQLTGQGGDPLYRSVIRGQLTVVPMGNLQAPARVSITGRSYVISGVSVAASEEIVALATDLQKLINDVTRMRNILDTLITQLKA